MTPVSFAAAVERRNRAASAARLAGAAAALFALIALAGGAVALGASPGASGEAATPGASAAASVSIIQKTFEPAQVTVHVGETVVWTVTQGINEPHTVTSGNYKDATSGTEFDSGLVLKANGDSFSHTFDKAGSFSYFCSIHPDTMAGSVTVLAAGQTAGASTPASAAAPSAAASAAASPGASGAPAEPRAPEPPIDPGTKLAAAGILVLALVILFGWGAAYRRMNP